MLILFCKTLVALLLYDLIGFGHNFARMHRFVSSRRVSNRTPDPDAAAQVCQAINYACVVYPKRVLCLQRSAVTTCLLRSLGMPAQLVIGAQKLPFRAHAWTEIDGRAVNERIDVQKRFGVWERC